MGLVTDWCSLHGLFDVEVFTFILVVRRFCFSCRFYLLKRKSRLEPATTAQFFFNRLRAVL